MDPLTADDPRVIGGPVRSRLLVAGGVVCAGSLDHHVYAVRA